MHLQQVQPVSTSTENSVYRCTRTYLFYSLMTQTLARKIAFVPGHKHVHVSVFRVYLPTCSLLRSLTSPSALSKAIQKHLAADVGPLPLFSSLFAFITDDNWGDATELTFPALHLNCKSRRRWDCAPSRCRHFTHNFNMGAIPLPDVQRPRRDRTVEEKEDTFFPPSVLRRIFPPRTHGEN